MFFTAIGNLICFVGIFFLIKFFRNKIVNKTEQRIYLGIAVFFTGISLAIHGVILDFSFNHLFLSLASIVCALSFFDQDIRKQEIDKKEVIKWEKKQ